MRLRGPDRLGKSEILREIVHADHLVAQLRRALEQGLLFGADDARGESSLDKVLSPRTSRSEEHTSELQ